MYKYTLTEYTYCTNVHNVTKLYNVQNVHTVQNVRSVTKYT